MADGITNFGGTFSVTAIAANADVADAAAYALLVYTEVPNIGSHGDSGVSQNVVSYSTWDRNVTSKGKGEADAGSPTVEFLDVDSPGMVIMLANADVNNANSYAFKVEWPDGSIEYNRGIITGPMRMKGGNEDFKRLTFNLGFSQQPIITPAP
jgi:hypothetical protein